MKAEDVARPRSEPLPALRSEKEDDWISFRESILVAVNDLKHTAMRKNVDRTGHIGLHGNTEAILVAVSMLGRAGPRSPLELP